MEFQKQLYVPNKNHDEYLEKNEKTWQIEQKYLFLHCEKFVTKSS